MKCVTKLPAGYGEILSIDIQKDKKLALLVNGFGLVILIVLVAIGNLLVPITTIFLGMNLLLMSVGTVVYIVLHELVHGMCMKYFGSRTVKYGFTGLYAYAGSQDYFEKRDYLIIALAPVVVLGAVLLVLNSVVGIQHFWGIYFIQIANLSGAAGDLYVTYLFSRLPSDILVQDVGVSMVVYHPSVNHIEYLHKKPSVNRKFDRGLFGL